MFCFQCQETAKGTGCILKGVCGKNATTARYMDLLLFVVRGISVVADQLRENNVPVARKVDSFVLDALFCTITNANFDDESIVRRIDDGLQMRDSLKAQAAARGVSLPAVDELEWTGEREAYDDKAATVGVLREKDEDLRSLKELIVYGLKGMAAYLEHAMRLGHDDESIHRFMQHTLAQTATGNLSAAEWTALALKTGEVGVQTMALLDRANTTAYGHPEMTSVDIGVRHRPGILISGHDLHDLEELLEQTRDTGIDIYTHGEMLPAHYYPAFKKYPHFAGNYGNAWWKQREEFASFNGPILFTTNCIVPPLHNAEYKSRMFTTNATGFPGCKHIGNGADGHKDYSEIIEMAKTCQPPTEIEHGTIVGGFAHAQVLALADKVVYTGAIDAYFDYKLGPLEYRSVRFETEVLDKPNFQGNAAVNYTDRETPWTRIIEHKWFEFGKDEEGHDLPKTVISREYSSEWKPGDEPYYPVNDEKNGKLYQEYRALADKEEGIIFGGRLGEYKYYDMDAVIDSALDMARKELG